MRIWLSRNSDIPIREQLVTQIILGIVSGDLEVKQRLPSTRDLARRYQIHANTVSAAYRELAKRGWVDFRKGSGVYVRAKLDGQGEKHLDLDQLTARFFRMARQQGHTLADIQVALQRALARQPPDHFLLIEPDIELRAILLVEIAHAVNVRVAGVGFAELAHDSCLAGAVPMVLFGHAGAAREQISRASDLLVLHSASVVERMRGQRRPSADALVAIVSRWPDFLQWSRTMLVAAGLDDDGLSLRDARRQGWEKGITSADFVITDSLMASRIPPGCEIKIFQVVSDSSLAEIREYAARFF